jgi:hypothetical protein
LLRQSKSGKKFIWQPAENLTSVIRKAQLPGKAN